MNIFRTSNDAIPLPAYRLSRLSGLVIAAALVGLALGVLGPDRRTIAADWPQFRGPDGQGHSSERGLPLAWSETENVVWRTPIEGLGWSSPVVQGRQVWLTTAIEEQGSLRAVCLDAATGHVLRDVEVFRKQDLGPINPKNSHASPTPFLDGDRVYVHFGVHGTACLSSRGDVPWRVEDLRYDHRHGPAGSPVVWRDCLIFNCDGADTQCVVALDKQTGRIRWRADRQGRMAYSTPLVVSVGGVDQVISPGGGVVASYAAATGKEIWRLPLVGDSVVTRPMFGHGLIFVTSGYGSAALYAVRADSLGEIATTDAAWTLRRGVPNDPSPLLVGDELYVLSDQGVTTCLDARTGKSHWQLRLPGAYSASPIVADERIYFTNEDGLTTIMAAAKTPKKLATNQLNGRTLASLATADGAIFLRTDKALYRIGAANADARSSSPVAARSFSPAKR